MSIFTHACVGANDIAASKAFYDAALGALGIDNLGAMGDKAFLYGKGTPEFLVLTPANGEPACHANGGTLALPPPPVRRSAPSMKQGLPMAAPAKERLVPAPSRRRPMPPICATHRQQDLRLLLR